VYIPIVSCFFRYHICHRKNGAEDTKEFLDDIGGELTPATAANFAEVDSLLHTGASARAIDECVSRSWFTRSCSVLIWCSISHAFLSVSPPLLFSINTMQLISLSHTCHSPCLSLSFSLLLTVRYTKILVLDRFTSTFTTIVIGLGYENQGAVICQRANTFCRVYKLLTK
jgi:hypothetical protein